MPKEEAEKKKKEIWSVGLTIITEKDPPQKVLTNSVTGESIPLEYGIVRILNDLEQLKKLLD